MKVRHLLLAASAIALAACGGNQEQAASTVAVAESARNAQCTDAYADGLRQLNGIDLQQTDVLTLQKTLQAGTLTSTELVVQQLARIEAYDRANAALNSVRSLAPDAIAQAQMKDAERAAGQAKGPLHGLTVLLKDNTGTRDMPTTAGSIALARNFPVAEAFITQQLRDAGAIVLGKTNLSEFANWMDLRMPNGYSSLGGQVIAPYRFDLDPSGSSTGSGVAGTMAFGTVTIGTETSGSIISPATRHSLVGVKPTIGLVSRSGIIPLAHSFDTAGPMTRNVTDAAAVLGVIAGLDPLDDASPRFEASPLAGAVPDYLAALSDTALEGVRLGVREADLTDSGLFGAALAVLEAEGATIVPFDGNLPPSVGSFASITAIPNEFKLFLNRYLAEEAGPGIPVQSLSEIIAYNEGFPGAVKFGQSLLQLSDAQSGQELDPVYVLSRETAILSAQTWIDQQLSSNDLDAIVGPNGANTGITAAAGYPNVTVPMGYDGQVPQGLAFASTAFDEADLLAYAYDYEQATQLRQPPTVLNAELALPCSALVTE
ncbi:amidase family protein [Algiphilus sp.]|uniref:amidase family protein n=1 Tax=Algiphilus sp. TaxID=1872431 RepID=UPI003B527D1C